MVLTELVLKGAEKLSSEEQRFLVLMGLFANEILTLQKLLMCCHRDEFETPEDRAQTVFVVLFAKTLANKIWQGWELVQDVFHGAQVSRSDWMRENKNLTGLIRKMKKHFRDGCLLERIRNQFGYHYDLASIERFAEDAISEQGFEVLYSDRTINSFYLSSEAIAWSAMLGAREAGEFEQKYPEFIDEVARRAGDFMDLVNGIMEAFVVHVVEDLGGKFENVSETPVVGVIDCSQVKYPVFLT